MEQLFLELILFAVLFTWLAKNKRRSIGLFILLGEGIFITCIIIGVIIMFALDLPLNPMNTDALLIPFLGGPGLVLIIYLIFWWRIKKREENN